MFSDIPPGCNRTNGIVQSLSTSKLRSALQFRYSIVNVAGLGTHSTLSVFYFSLRIRQIALSVSSWRNPNNAYCMTPTEYAFDNVIDIEQWS